MKRRKGLPAWSVGVLRFIVNVLTIFAAFWAAVLLHEVPGIGRPAAFIVFLAAVGLLFGIWRSPYDFWWERWSRRERLKRKWRFLWRLQRRAWSRLWRFEHGLLLSRLRSTPVERQRAVVLAAYWRRRLELWSLEVEDWLRWCNSPSSFHALSGEDPGWDTPPPPYPPPDGEAWMKWHETELMKLHAIAGQLSDAWLREALKRWGESIVWWGVEGLDPEVAGLNPPRSAPTVLETDGRTDCERAVAPLRAVWDD